MRARNSQPSISGSMMSSVISASGCCIASTIAASAEAACSTREAFALELQAHQLRGLEVVFDHQRGARGRQPVAARQRRRLRGAGAAPRPGRAAATRP